MQGDNNKTTRRQPMKYKTIYKGKAKDFKGFKELMRKAVK